MRTQYTVHTLPLTCSFWLYSLLTGLAIMAQPICVFGGEVALVADSACRRSALDRVRLGVPVFVAHAILHDQRLRRGRLGILCQEVGVDVETR